MSKSTPQNNDPNQPLIISYLTLRKAVGILGFMLPIVLLIGNMILSQCKEVQDSISDYFYTKMGYVMVGTLCAVGLFMFCYKGYELRDTIASRIACVFALGIAFFPTTGPDKLGMCNFLKRNGEHWVSTFHNIFAALFFLTLAYFCLVLFVKTSGHPTKRKKERNVVYKICGYIILGCIILLFLYFKIDKLQEMLQDYKPILVLEALALWAFGISWLTKGEFILKDNK
jgi:hypothetical protein